MITTQEYICTGCRCTLNITGSTGINYCPQCNNIMEVKGVNE